MASLDECNIVPEGITFVFGSWICTANSWGGYTSHLANPGELEASPKKEECPIDYSINDLIRRCILPPPEELRRSLSST